MMTSRIKQFQSPLRCRIPGFGARLRALRRACNIKQAYVAQMAGVDQATVSRWENGVTIPNPDLADAVIKAIRPRDPDDSALRRLVESSTSTVHLISEIDHTLLAASTRRQAEWGVSICDLRGKSVWAAASPAIQTAESNLEALGWWETINPDPVRIKLEEYHGGFLPIAPGQMLWERVWLGDGQPARLCTLL